MSEKKKVNWLKETLDITKNFIFALLIVLLLTHFVIRPVQVKGPSMYPTLQNNELGFTNVIKRTTQKITRFEVVIALLDSNEQIVKRVIGLPGETLEFKDDVLYINGEAVEQTFLDDEYVATQKSMTQDKLFTEDFGPITLGDDEYFLMGDNRLHSTDSRYFGPFTSDKIIACSVYVWWPLDHWKAV